MRTPSQTVGPFLHIGLMDCYGPELVPPGSPGALRVSGVVLDGGGDAVVDALVEVWHPDVGFGRSDTRDAGRFAFVTRKPSDAAQAPHLEVAVFARGLLKQVVTRMYFPDEVEANAADAVLSRVEPERRATLVAVPEGAWELHFDIRLQGDDETVFFDL
jgi:protocatechuate 3,4-dioxygenase alpha subunit